MFLLAALLPLPIVSARDQDLLQAIWLAAARYVTSGQRIIALYLVVTECACSAGCVVFRSAHNAGELAPSVSGCGIIDELRTTRADNKKALRPFEDFFQSDGSCTIFQSCLCGPCMTDHACAIRERKKHSYHQAFLALRHLNSPSPSWLQYEGNSPHLLHWWEEA